MRQMNMKIQIEVGLEGMEDLRNFFSILFLFIIKKTKWVAELDLVELMDISEEIFTGVTELVMVSETADSDWAVVMEISGDVMVVLDATGDSEDMAVLDATGDSEDMVVLDATGDSEDMEVLDATGDSEDMEVWVADFPTLGLTTMEDVKPTFLVL